MHSFASLALTFASVIGFAASQSAQPTSVPKATRDQWCLSQTTSCPLICLQLPGTSAATESNSCSADTLSYSCVCSNGQSPNLTQYSQTIPYFICTQSNINCVNGCNGESSCQSSCQDNHPCGAQSPTKVNTSTLSTMMATGTNGAPASTASDGAVFTGFGGGSAATTTAASSKKGAASRTIVDFGQMYGLGVVAVSFFAGFALLL